MSVFARIIEGELPAEKIYEDDRLIVIKDIAPQAPIHLLIIPKKPWKNLQAIEEKDLSILAHIGHVAQQMALEMAIEEGYRLVTNCGSDAGQTVFHLHFHLLGGRILTHMG